MEIVPPNLIHGEQMALVGLLILPAVALAAFVDPAFFGSQNENIGVEFIEVEAESGGQADQRGLVFVVAADEFETDDFFGLELVLHEVPVHHAAVRGDRVEVVFFGNVGVPVDLPHGVGVLLGPHVRLVDRPFVLVPDVVHQHATGGVI